MKTILQRISARTGCMPIAIERYIYYTGIKPKKLLDQLEAADMPSTKTFYKWLENEDRGKQYARACEYRADAIFEEILNICDDKTEDYISTKSGAVGNNAAVQRARLQVDTRKWIVSKLNPKKYSDKIQNEVTGDMAINWVETKTNDTNK
jgi:hypothetical protein